MDTYASAINAQISAKEERNEFEVKKWGFIEYVQRNPNVLKKWENTSFSLESAIQIEFNSWCSSEECRMCIEKYKRQRKIKAWGCLTLIVIVFVLFILRVSGFL